MDKSFYELFFLGAEMIKELVTTTLEKKGFLFRCPYENEDDEPCEQMWDYDLVRHVACFTDEEKNRAEKQMGDNYLVCAAKAQKCPQCKIYCVKQQEKVRRVNCVACWHTFCWACLHEWQSTDTKHCGNEDCTGRDPRLRYLEKNSKKKIMGYSGVESYDVRACPGCGFIIHHTEGCKQMQCYTCRIDFCFVCLKIYNRETRTWPCGSYSAKCEPVPIQTELPETNEE